MRSEDEFSRMLFVKCDCGAHAIGVAKLDDDDDIYIELWYMGRRDMTLWERLKAIWKVLVRGGDLLFEEVILPKALELKSFLEEVLAVDEEDSKG